MNFDLPFQFAAILVSVGAMFGVTRSWWRPFVAVVIACSISLLIAFVTAHGMFHFMRLCSWMVFLHFPIQLLAWSYHSRNNRLGTGIALGFVLCLIGIAVDAFFIEPHALETRRLSLTSTRLQTPVRIVVLSDIQTDQVGAYERMVIEKVVQLNPDVLLLPGDFLQIYDETRPEQVRKLRELLQLLSPRLGAWAVQGNVDPSDSEVIFAGTSVRYMEQTETVRIADDILLTGLSLKDSFDAKFVFPAGDSGFRIVMGHAPDFSLGTINGELFVAGHTHGGQVQLPFLGPIITLSKVPRDWAKGGATALSADRTLVVSRGIGME